MSKPYKLRLITLIVLLLIAIFCFTASLNEDRKGILTVAFLDVGQGDSIFIESPSGNQMLIDGGPGKAVLRELSKVMPFYDRSIDVVLATHADQDHIGGLLDVLNKYKTDIFIESGVPSESSTYRELEKIIEKQEKNLKKILARRGMVIDLGGGTILEILFPDRDPTGMETNSASVVTKLVYGENEFLLTGDSPSSIENYLVSVESQGVTLGLESDVLKAGHHGSKTSSSESFVAAVSPEYVVISAGKDNRYNHPNQEVLDILNNFGADILRTDEQGRIIFKSDGLNLSQETAK
ncbi:MAG: MBL fold metallo-hydrolase [Candidatus Zambryskibacteria bacterium]|nr:MBL fold metallo-hydrolase [Candidatus Zambryskibacteria bacterium]